MKKLLLVAIIAIAFFGAANAQLGITGGGNLAKYKIKDDGDRQAIFAWNAGLFYRIKSKHGILAVQPALTFTGKGADKYNDPFSNDDIEKYTNRLSYVQLSVPILLSATDIEGSGIGIDFGIGPYFSRLVKASYTAKPYDGASVTSDYKIGSSSADDFKPMDAGLTLLGGLRLGGVALCVQYDLGLSNVNPVSTAPAIKTRAVMFNIFIGFGK